ncbi:MAG: hypothetical protein PWP20_1104 [Eubacteriaceae bacterium]|nr:hypothetical protein [Eubacteriaceae bacterium]
MRHSFKNSQIELTVILTILQLLLSPLFLKNVIQAETVNPRVLFLSSYSQSFESDPQKIEGALSVFQGDYDMDVEYMDSKRFETPENKALFYQLLQYKLSNVAPYDAIIVADDYALQFALDFQDDLFKEIPIVFIGINDKNWLFILIQKQQKLWQLSILQLLVKAIRSSSKNQCWHFTIYSQKF